MAYHPLNLTIRFFLELAAWYCMGLFGLKLGESGIRYFYMLFIPILSMVIWGVFNVPGDRSRSGEAPVIVPGWLRLMIELGTFIFGAWILFYLNYTTLGYVFFILVLLHYLLSLDRIKWLFDN